MTQTQQIILRPHSLSSDPGVVAVRAGQTIRAMLLEASGGAELSPDISVRVGGYAVPAAYWDRLRPKPGTAIHVVRDSVAGGGDTWKQVLGAVVLIVVSYFTAGAATTWGASLLGAGASAGAVAAVNIGIMMVATLAVSALTAPPQATSPGGTEGQWNQLTGSQNSVNRWGAIPFVIGESRFFPPHAAMPYGQVIGESSYQHCMFDLGHGDLDVSDIRIGDTPIGDYKDVQWEITKGDSLLYQDDVAELAVNSTMVAGDRVTRTSSPGIDAVGFEIVFGQGLFWVGTKGRPADLEARFSVRWRFAGTGAWQQVPANARRSGLRRVNGAEEVRTLNKKPFGVGISWDVPAGSQVEIEIQRQPINDTDTRNTYVQSATWTVLRSIKHTNPSTTGTNKLYVRIRANEQLTGALQTLSCMVRQKVRTYNRATGSWSAPQITLNPAWCTWWLMTQCPAVAKHVPLSRMDVESFADYAEWCDLHQLETRMVVDGATTMGELIRKVLSGALASPGHRDGRYSVVFDHGETLETATFTPMEITGFTVARAFTRIPHALKVQFKNPAADWQDDEVVVVRDGYSYRGVDARGNPSTLPQPTDFETLRVEQAMLPRQAWRMARYHFAQALFRPNIYSFNTDHAGLGTVRGDVIDVAHDVMDNGSQGWGRVIALTEGGPGGAAATLVLDETIDCPAGQLYGVQFRTSMGEKLLAYATPHSVRTDTFYLAELPSGISNGDAAVIGKRDAETVKLLVTGVRAAQDLGCGISCVAYDPRVAPFWANPPASIISEISGRDYGLPPPPVITGIVSSPANDETDNAGIPVPTVGIGFNDRAGYMDVPLVVLR